MAIKITENSVVNYENEPNVDRELFPNISETGYLPEDYQQLIRDVNTLKSDVTTINGEITEIQGDITTAENNIEDLDDGIDALKNDFIETFDVTLAPNLLDINSVVDGYIRENGSVTVTGAWKTSGFIPVEYGYIYTLSYTYSDARAKHPVYFRLEYDENKKIISGTYASNGTNGYTPASSDAKFVRFSFEWVDGSSEWCFVKGTSIEYTVFGDKSFTLKEDANSSAVTNVISAVNIINRRNLFDREKVVDGYIKNAQGEIAIYGDWVTTDYMPVTYGKQYWCYDNSGSIGMYFVLELNEAMMPVSYVSQLATTYYTPSSATVKYVRFSVSNQTIALMAFEETTQSMCIYTPYGKELLPIYRNTLYGKKWVAVGDSLTEKNASAISNYTDFITVQNNMSLVNMGTGGTGYMRGYDADRAFYQRVANIPDCDIITVFGSGNDLAYYSDIGDVTDATTATICGCINETLDVIFANHPTTPLLVIAPTPWAGNTPDMTTGMSVYCEKLQAICVRRGVAYLDLFHHSGLRPDDDSQNSLVFYDGSLDGHSDFVHPNKLGHSIIAPRIMQAMESIMIF